MKSERCASFLALHSLLVFYAWARQRNINPNSETSTLYFAAEIWATRITALNNKQPPRKSTKLAQNQKHRKNNNMTKCKTTKARHQFLCRQTNPTVSGFTEMALLHCSAVAGWYLANISRRQILFGPKAVNYSFHNSTPLTTRSLLYF